MEIGPRESASAPRQGCRRPAQLECPQTVQRTESEAPSLCANPTSLHGYRDVHNRRNCTCETSMHLSSQQRACHHLVQELQLRNSTGCTVWTKTPVLHNNGQDNLFKSWTSPRRRPAQQGHRPPRRRTARNAAQTQPARPAATTPPQPRHHHTTPPSEPISPSHPVKKFSAGASTPEPELDPGRGAPSPC